MKLTAEKRKRMPLKEFAGGGPKGKRGFPMEDHEHQELAISGAKHSYNAGNISKGKEQAVVREARAKLHQRLGILPRKNRSRG